MPIIIVCWGVKGPLRNSNSRLSGLAGHLSAPVGHAVRARAPEDVSTRTVDIHISELRAKLEPVPAKPVHIITVRKVGYRFEV